MNKKFVTSSMPYKHSQLSEKIIGAFFTVYNALGYGFLEKVSVNALKIELEQRSMKAIPEMKIVVSYAGQVVGEYYADLILDDLVIVEIKAAKALANEHEAQLLNYLKATPYEVGLPFNFGPKAEHKRRAFENSRKEWWVAQNKSNSSA